jgi:LysM repeat protein
MDTISQESNGSSSYLPIAALIIGLIAGVLAGVALAKVSAVNRQLEAQASLSARMDTIESQVRQGVTTAEQASQSVSRLRAEMQGAFNQVSDVIGSLRGEIAKAQETRPAPAPSATAAKSGSATPTAGPGEYVVKSGDTGTRIANSLGVTVQALEAVNPGINWNRLHVGQKIKVPSK